MPQEVQNVLRLLPPKPYTDRVNSKPLTPEFTCLLIRVCACSAQYLTTEIQQKFESELGESVQSLSEAYHHAAKQLSNTIPPGKGGLAQVQQLFLTAAWFKSESFFVESWHALSTCIHEAQELGMHKSSPRSGLSEFDLEIRRRIWCLLYSWDW
ncbi:hypothetical protein N7462_005561 [Penicillium macrosclerotiorum]|uniref:uncharacterized protein n=1 Tax=Penicillium macrosclerotiorum TaxID=303699 RepID=UPI0025489B6E|nr:uncharacterized protein N7462_005561 [Penicillium macrosclerotiorum]KAJ5682396.1 hypothetical protein N7462_005561 [Penicillium macrosclerotiorum]